MVRPDPVRHGGQLTPLLVVVEYATGEWRAARRRDVADLQTRNARGSPPSNSRRLTGTGRPRRQQHIPPPPRRAYKRPSAGSALPAGLEIAADRDGEELFA
jgi:hypothetical protein